MNDWVNNILMNELLEVHTDFNNIISIMKENDITYPYDNLITLEGASYQISYNAISRMIKSYEEYNILKKQNTNFFEDEARIYIKYIMLYVVSIIIIRVFSKTLSSEKINEIWYALAGIVLGSVNTNLIYKNINNYRYGSKDNRMLMDDLSTLKEDYNDNYEIARREIDYMFSLNRNLEKELLKSKVYQKNKMH